MHLKIMTCPCSQVPGEASQISWGGRAGRKSSEGVSATCFWEQEPWEPLVYGVNTSLREGRTQDPLGTLRNGSAYKNRVRKAEAQAS